MKIPEDKEVVSLPRAPLWKDRGHAELRVPRKGAFPELKAYVWLHMIHIEGGIDATEADKATAEEYLKTVAEKVFECDAVRQSTAYKEITPPRGTPARVDFESSPKYYLMFRFMAFDLEEIKAMLKDHWDEVAKTTPAPGILTTEFANFWVENHHQERHEPFSAHLQGVTDPNNPNAVKMVDAGLSRPAWDPDDPKMQSNYIDWYQEVRQHDVLRCYFPYDTSHQWLLEEGEDCPVYVFSMYEYFVDPQMSQMRSMALAGAYNAISKHRGEGGLYGPLFEGSWGVLAEHFKRY